MGKGMPTAEVTGASEPKISFREKRLPNALPPHSRAPSKEQWQLCLGVLVVRALACKEVYLIGLDLGIGLILRMLFSRVSGLGFCLLLGFKLGFGFGPCGFAVEYPTVASSKPIPYDLTALCPLDLHHH